MTHRGHYGYVHIRNGKTEFRKRGLPITARAKEILTRWMAKSRSDFVFTREDAVSPVSAFTLIQQQERMRERLNLPWDACVHSARHTALTNLGLTGVDAFTLQRAAGHSNIATTRKYVHPTPPTMKDAFQKKVRNERRDRRAARKQLAKMLVMPSSGASDDGWGSSLRYSGRSPFPCPFPFPYSIPYTHSP
jgi:integrase